MYPANAHLLNLVTGAWTQLPNMIGRRDSHICHAIKNGTEIIVAGGEAGFHMTLDSVEVLSLEADKEMSWRASNPLPKAVLGAAKIEYKVHTF